MKSLFSPLWYRVADLKPRLRPHAELHRQRFRGQVWYVLQDHQTGRFHRISPVANLILSLMNGQRTVRELWNIAGSRAGDDPPTQDEVIQLLAQLHGSDLVQAEIPPDIAEIAERGAKTSRREILARLRNPLALRFPVFDPDRVLDRTLFLVRPLFTSVGFAVWLAFLLTAIMIVTLNWQELTTNLSDRVLATQNLFIILCIYPVLKGFHELGHAYATRVWGGEVHEIGIMLLILVPVPYVDASSASAFASKRQRIVVGAGGILVELFFASLAAIVWLNASPGLVRTIAFNVMLIGGVSTIAFNGNPLLRFDGYYMLADLLEIPNLATRANRYLFYLTQRYLFQVDTDDDPVTGHGEPKWFVLYALASFVYRMFVALGIAFLLASKFLIFGAAMALWTVGNLIVWPLVKGVRFIVSDQRLAANRSRAYAVTGGLAALAFLLLFVVPTPYAIVAEGVVWIPQNAEVRSKTDGFVETITAQPDSQVKAQSTLLQLGNPLLDSRVMVQEAQLQEAQNRYDAARVIDRVQAEIFLEEVHNIESTLVHYRRTKSDLTVRADQSGQLIIPDVSDLPGRYVKKGDLLAYVIDNRNLIVRVVVTQDDIDLVRSRAGKVSIRLADRPETEYPARIVREVPSGDQELPSLALSTKGGGAIALNPARSQKPQALYNIFQFDVAPTVPVKDANPGVRVYVRVDLGAEPIAWRFLRASEQTFLNHLHL